MRKIDHDKLFKELLTTFFVEFIELFVPGVVRYLDQASIEFVDKELYTGDKKLEADIVVKARFKGKKSFFLIHTESQAQYQAEFPRRLFRYFAALHDKFGLPVYPIALLSYGSPVKPHKPQYLVKFTDLEVLRFNFMAVQLNRLNWRRYAKNANPVAAALMAKMNIAPGDRAQVKLECLRMLTTLSLGPPKERIISGFVDTYLRLNPDETKQYETKRSNLSEPEREAIMEMETSWSREGRRIGRKEGRQEGLQEGRQRMLVLVSTLLTSRFGALDRSLLDRLQSLKIEQLTELGTKLLELSSIADLDRWLTINCIKATKTTQLRRNKAV